MTRQSNKFIFLFTVVLLFLFVCPMTWAINAGVIKVSKGPKKPEVGKTGEKVRLPENLEIDEVDSIIAQLSDEQVRRLLIAALKKEARKDVAGEKDIYKIGRLAGFVQGLKYQGLFIRERLGFLKTGILTTPRDLSRVGAGLVKEDGKGSLLKNIIAIIAIFGLSLLLDALFRRYTAARRRKLESADPSSWQSRLGRRITTWLMDVASIGLFTLLTYGMILIFFETSSPNRLPAVTYLVAFIIVRGVNLISQIFLAPLSSSLRLLPVADDTARLWHKWIVRISVVGSFGWLTCGLLRLQRLNEASHLFLVALVGLVMVLMMIRMISQLRNPVAQAIRKDGLDSRLRTKFADVWHRYAIAYVLTLWIIWVMTLILMGSRAVVPAVATVLGIPVFFVFDRLIQGILNTAIGHLKPNGTDRQVSGSIDPDIQETSEKPKPIRQSDRPDIRRFNLTLRYSLRILLIIFLFFWLMSLWGVGIHIGRTVAKAAFSIFVAVLFSYVSWELINVPIRRKLEEQMGDDDEDREEGGSGGSRIGTLLLLFRKFALVVLVSMVIMIILSNLGVNIGPLIAGAGVIGLAIGFGAQTLVKDIISGVFFLVDDAFRVGDYVDTGKVKGMVEHISLRSLRLRNPRGMVHTIPFGDIGSVTNFSRDYIIMKLDLRVRYDTDIDTVRKIIKKINEDLSQDEEIAPKLLGKIKSQGIREMDDSVMIVRVKFKTLPGEQFVIRREVYQRIQKAFKEKGIPFAHRNVTVYLPLEATPSGSGGTQENITAAGTSTVDKKLIEAGAAAALAAKGEDKPGSSIGE